jgi:Na+-transporting methylmalonyl-CoA/oxaloacetate decarboxylase gamma subunit
VFLIYVVVFVGAFAKSLHRPERRAATYSASAQ